MHFKDPINILHMKQILDFKSNEICGGGGNGIHDLL